jgi:hypothetical protein
MAGLKSVMSILSAVAFATDGKDGESFSDPSA